MKFLRYMLVLIALAYGLATQAADLSERLTALQGADGVLAARQVGTPQLLLSTPLIHRAEFEYWVADGDVARVNKVALYVFDYGSVENPEAAYWARRVPSVLAPAPAAETYITDRNTPFTSSQIESYCNSLWVDANPTAGPILEFEVSAVDGRTVRVSGKFDVGNSAREARVYYIWLVDANGSTAPGNANVKFERITTAVVTP